MSKRRFPTQVAFLAALALLCALPVFAGDPVITNGIDLWRTPGTGGTYADFANNPLPAGFFCASSAPFTGRIVFKGEPIKTQPAKALGVTDTIIQRLDDAVFTKDLPAIKPFEMRGGNGTVSQVGAAFFRGQEVATTRVQVKALSFVGVRPVETACGAFQVRASLAGEQPVTDMVIVRDQESGGSFYAPLSLNIKLTFTPVAGGTPVELVKSIRFPAKPLSAWTSVPSPHASYNGFVRVASTGGEPDLMLPGTSNFAAGFKGNTPGGRLGVARKDVYTGTPYCDGSGIYYADDCHDAGPVPINATISAN